MSSLYNKFYNLFHTWLSTEEEDYDMFEEWYDDLTFDYEDGVLRINDLGQIISPIDNTVQQILFEDTATINQNITQYDTLNGATISWNNNFYTATNNGTNLFETVGVSFNNLPNNIRAEVTLRVLNSGTNIQPRFGFAMDNTNGYYCGVSLQEDKTSIRYYNGTDNTIQLSSSFIRALNTWYTLRLDYKQGILTAYVYNSSNNELLVKLSVKINFVPVGLMFGMVANNVQIEFKNLKLIQL